MNMSKIKISQKELEEHLKHQISFLETSANAFDTGREEEYKRLALAIRILVRDTSSSYSLLRQMGKNLKFHDTSPDLDSNNILPRSGLIAILVKKGEPDQSHYIAILDDSPHTVKTIDFDSWWNKPVFVNQQGGKLTRKDLILTASDQDGGAHVDPSLEKTYANISRKGLGWAVNHGAKGKILDKPERATIRQIAHEVLKTLKPGYKKKIENQTGVIIYDFRVV